MFKALLICAIVGLAVASPLSQVRRPAAKVVAKVVAHPAPAHPAPAHTVAHVSGDDVHAETLSRDDDVRADGFHTVLETSNHINEDRNGDEHGNIHGNFGWVATDGEHYTVTYVADENGYQPQGAHLPTPPPIPVEIQRALDWIASHPAAPEYNDH